MRKVLRFATLDCLLSLCLTWATHPADDRAKEGFNSCPLASEIYPCSCTFDEDLYQPDLYCPHIECLDQLQKIFTRAHFPEKRFWRIQVSGAPLGDIPEDVFDKVSFDEIHLNDCNITSVHPNAFTASKPNMDTWEMYSNKLTDSSFPWSTLIEYPKLWWIHVDHNNFTEFPNLSSPYLKDVDLSENHITYFGREHLSGTPNLRILTVSPDIKSFFRDSFLDLTQLEELHLSNNNIGDLNAGQITLNSESFKYLYLSNCSISYIHPEAITGVMSNRLKVFLEHNHLTQLWEEVFRPLMDHMLDGWGELDVADNPLRCDCNMYWLLSNETLLNNVRTGTCDDGTPLTEVDTSDWKC